MHNSIVRTDAQVKEHLDVLSELADNKDEEIAIINYNLYNLLGNYYSNSTLNPEDFVSNHIADYASFSKSKKLEFDLRLWLIGKLVTAPTYNPLKEVQFSTEQVLEDFGRTSYTEFQVG